MECILGFANKVSGEAANLSFGRPCASPDIAQHWPPHEVGRNAWPLLGLEAPGCGALLAKLLRGLLRLADVRQLVVCVTPPCSQTTSSIQNDTGSEWRPTVVGASTQTADDLAVFASKQQRQDEEDASDNQLSSELQKQERLQEFYATLSAELDASRKRTPELGRKVRKQQADFQLQAQLVEQILGECHCLDRRLLESEAGRREAKAEIVRVCRQGKALQASTKEMYAQQEQALQLQHVREELLTVRAKIDIERQVSNQLKAQLLQLPPKSLQPGDTFKDCKTPQASVERFDAIASDLAPNSMGTPSVLRRTLEFETQSRSSSAAAKCPTKVAAQGGGVHAICGGEPFRLARRGRSFPSSLSRWSG